MIGPVAEQADVRVLVDHGHLFPPLKWCSVSFVVLQAQSARDSQQVSASIYTPQPLCPVLSVMGSRHMAKIGMVGL